MGTGNHKNTSFSTETHLPIPRYGVNRSDGYAHAMMMSPKGETAVHGGHCPFSSPEPLGLICNRPLVSLPRDQETTGSGDEDGHRPGDTVVRMRKVLAIALR